MIKFIVREEFTNTDGGYMGTRYKTFLSNQIEELESFLSENLYLHFRTLIGCEIVDHEKQKINHETKQ